MPDPRPVYFYDNRNGTRNVPITSSLQPPKALWPIKPFSRYWRVSVGKIFGVMCITRWGNAVEVHVLFSLLVSSIPHMTPQWSKCPPLVIQPMCGSPSIEAVGMASAVLAPGIILLTGGCGRSGRDTAARVLIKEKDGWKCACVETHGDKGDLISALFLLLIMVSLLEFF